MRAAVAAALCLLLAGCATATPTPTPTATGTAAPGFDEGTREVQRPSAEPGGTLRVVMDHPCDASPPAIDDAACADLARATTRQLMAYAALPGRFGSVVVPDLAMDAGSSPDGGRTWTYVVRDGARWSDGSAVTAADAVAGIAALDAARDDVEVARIEPDGQRLTITLAAPQPAFDQLLALPIASPRRASLASGPFMRDAGGVLVRNPAWNAASDPIRRPLVDRIEVAVASPEGAIAAVLDGRADVSLATRVPRPAAEALLADPVAAPRIDEPGTGAVVFLQLGDERWTTRCRQGLFSGLDRVAAVTALGGPSAARIATTMSAPTIASYEPSYRPFSIGDGTGDPDAATTALRGCPRTLSMAYGVELDAAAETVMTALARVGIVVTPVREGVPAAVPADAPVDAVLRQWTAPLPGVWGFWTPLAAPLGLRAVDTLLGSTEMASTDPEVQADLGRLIDRLVLDDARLIPIATLRRVAVRPAGLTNVATSGAFAGLYDVVGIGVR